MFAIHVSSVISIAGEFYFLCLPIDFGIILFQPVMSKKYVVSTEVGQSHGYLLFVPPYLQFEQDELRNWSSVVEGSVSIVDRDWDQQFMYR